VRPADRPPKFDTEDDVSTATLKAGTVPIDLDDEMKEITIRFDFQPRNSKAAKKVAIVHTHLLSKMKEAFANDILVFKNKGNMVKNINPINWNPIMHQSLFNLHASQGSKNRKNKYTIIHRICTSHLLSTVHNYNMINSLLNQHSCFMREHSNAYLIGIDPKHYTPEAANKVISDMMEKKCQGKCPPPLYDILLSTHFIDDCNVSSKAFAIKYEQKHGKEVIQKIEDAFATRSTQFLMVKLCYAHDPKSFHQKLQKLSLEVIIIFFQI
jgi:hypothetical protein